MARKLGKTTVDLGDIESIKSESYRDTRGISVEQFKSMLETIASGRSSTNDPSTSIRVRDYAIMLLFWGNALRRGEIASANIEDFLPQQQKLMILGKGKRAKVAIDLTDRVSYALEEWVNFHPCNLPEQPLSCRTQPGGNQRVDAPLITSLSHNCYGARITGDSIYRIVQGYAEVAGITSGRQANERRVSPHRLRHIDYGVFGCF